jgi:Tol biopolymer transport system component
MRTLLWKEWRENWAIVVMAIGAICLLAYLLLINREFHPAINDIKVVFFFVPLFVTIITANLFSTEFGHNTMSFLLVQPIPRSKLWFTKAGFGIFLVLLLILGSGFGVYLVSQLTSHPIPLKELIDIQLIEDVDVILMLCLLYASGLFIAVMGPNTIVTAFGSLLFAGLIAIIWSFTGEMFYVFDRWYWSIWILISFLTVSSYYVFTRPEVLLTKKKVKTGLLFLILIFLSYTTIAVLVQSNFNDLFYKYKQISNIDPKVVIPSRNLVLTSISKVADQGYSHSTRLCLISLDNNKKYTYLPRGYYCERLGGISPDNRYIVLSNSRKIFGLVECRLFNARTFLLDLTTLQIKRFPLKGEGLLKVINSITWSPDGRKLIYAVSQPFEQGYQYRMVDINTHEDKVLNFSQDFSPYNFYELSWAKDGNSMFIRSYYSYDRIREQTVVRLAQLSLDGKILWQNVQYQTFAYPNISPDKNWLLYSQDTSDQSELRKAYLKNLTTGESTYILSSPKIKSGLWSPDSKWIAISTISTTTEYSLWLVNLEMKDKRLLISERANDVYFRGWSNDSRKIIFDVAQFGKEPKPTKAVDIYTNEIHKIPFHFDYFTANLSLPGGEFLITKDKILYKVSLDGKQKKQIFP